MSITETGRGSARGIVAPMMAIISALLVLAFLFQERPADLSQVPDVGGFVTVELAAQALGGFIVGWLVAGLFGRERVFGWMLSVLAGFFATLLSGALGGVLKSLPVFWSEGVTLQEIFTVAGNALVGVMAAAGNPMVGLGWVALILLTHFLALRQRRSARAL